MIWLQYHKKKWRLQLEQRRIRCGKHARKKGPGQSVTAPVIRNTGTIAGFIKKAQQTLLECPWQVIQVKNCHSSQTKKKPACLLLKKYFYQIFYETTFLSTLPRMNLGCFEFGFWLKKNCTF